MIGGLLRMLDWAVLQRDVMLGIVIEMLWLLTLASLALFIISLVCLTVRWWLMRRERRYMAGVLALAESLRKRHFHHGRLNDE